MFHFLHRASRASGARRSSTASRCRSTRGCSTALGDVLVYGPVKNRFGLTRIRVGYTAGEAIGPEIFRFYRSLGINLKQLYGQTEASRLHHRAAGRRDLRRHGRQAEHRRRRQDRRERRGAVQVARRVPRLLQGPGEDRRDQDAGRLGAHRRRRLLRSEDRPPEDHRPRQGCRAAQGRHAVRAEIHREQAEVLSRTSRRRWRSATGATSSP